jgi:hypothetical protein
MKVGKSLRGRPKEISEERVNTTARIPKPLQKVVQKLCIDLELNQTDALNEGLELWLIYRNADKALKIQLDHQLKKLRNTLGGRNEKADEEGHRAAG